MQLFALKLMPGHLKKLTYLNWALLQRSPKFFISCITCLTRFVDIYSFIFELNKNWLFRLGLNLKAYSVACCT